VERLGVEWGKCESRRFPKIVGKSAGHDGAAEMRKRRDCCSQGDCCKRKLSKLTIKVEPQGSYHNQTNVREDSDVDVRVECSDSFFFELPKGLTNVDCGFIVPGPVNYAIFKNDVEAALTSYFKNGHVTRGKKAFDIKENTYRIAADVLPVLRVSTIRREQNSNKRNRVRPLTSARVFRIGRSRATPTAS